MVTSASSAESRMRRMRSSLALSPSRAPGRSASIRLNCAPSLPTLSLLVLVLGYLSRRSHRYAARGADKRDACVGALTAPLEVVVGGTALMLARYRYLMPYPTDQLARKLDSLAERLERPRGWVVKEALEGYLALDEQRRRQTLAALTEVDGGPTIDHAEVRAWVRSLVPPSPQIVALIPWRSAGRNQPTGTCADCTSSWSPSIPARPSARCVSSSIASSAFQPSRA